MKLTPKNYNPEIAHCAGARQYACKRCLRMALYETWRSFTPDMAEAIILMPPQAVRDKCPCKISMPAGYEKERKGRVEMEYTSYSGGIAV